MTDWTPIPGFEGYFIRYASARRVEVLGRRERVLKPLAGPFYAERHHYHLGGKRHQAGKLALLTWRPGEGVCRHLDGDPSNDSLDNLSWGSWRDDKLDWWALKRAKHRARLARARENLPS